MLRGKFITLEGGEGAGKSTQAKRLAAFLKKHGIKTVLTREVGGSAAAEDIRKLWLSQDEGYWEPLSELMMIFAARRDHLVRTVWPALKRGEWVVSDRFVDSSHAYQGIAKNAPTPKVVDQLYKQIAGDFEPDLTLLLDMPVEASMARVKARGGWDDRYQLKPAPFHKKLRAAYLALAKKNKNRIRLVDANREESAVADEIENIVRKRFKVK
ncbi:MAG TPA: dTMP kinase [Alphaproteobacteria bacterium]|nr:dTMP kinase [Alphaproteobacteria bacterium]